jgi:hypothetical protein
MLRHQVRDKSLPKILFILITGDMYDDGKPVNFPGTPMAYKQKVPPIEVKSEAGVKGKEE